MTIQMTNTVIMAVEKMLLPDIDPEFAAAINEDLGQMTVDEIVDNFKQAFPTWEAHQAHVNVLAGYYSHKRKTKKQ